MAHLLDTFLDDPGVQRPTSDASEQRTLGQIMGAQAAIVLYGVANGRQNRDQTLFTALAPNAQHILKRCNLSLEPQCLRYAQAQTIQKRDNRDVPGGYPWLARLHFGQFNNILRFGHR